MTSIAALNRVQGLINFKGLRRTLCTTQRAMAEQQHMGSDTAPQESKQAARKAIKAGLLKMPQDQMEAESAAIARHVLDAPFFSNSQNLGIYVHCARLREVDTSALLQSAMASAGKRCYVPVVEDKESNMKLLHLGERYMGLQQERWKLQGASTLQFTESGACLLQQSHRPS
uniref:5-formyltetrahydrofolate cyclo-ligase n=1 Tax=Dunaliella tertiolecta TaxID=3047 RepID=A0A7S3QMD7_DUNTE